MSLQNSPPAAVDPSPDEASLLARLTAKGRRHLERWGRRYVEMRIDALDR
jgi:hypothetical protein